MIRADRSRHVDALVPAYVNGTLGDTPAAQVRNHLEVCPLCRAELLDWEAVGAAARAAAAHLPAPSRGLLDRAWIKIERAEIGPGTAPSWREHLAAVFRRRPRFAVRLGAGALAAVLAAVMLVALGGVRANGLFSLFAPKQFSAVPLSFEDLRSLANLSQYGTYAGPESAQPQQVADAGAASAASGMTVLTPSWLPPGVQPATAFIVLPGNSASFTFDAAKARAAAAAQGKSLPVLPQDIDGTTLQVTTSAAVIAAHDETAAGSDADAGGTLLPAGVPKLIVGQTAAPTVTSDGAPAATLERYLLSQPGLSPELAAAIKALGDPSNTWPIPVPINLAAAHAIHVQGVSGLAVGDSTGLGGGILWQKDGVIYAVAGSQTEKDLLALQTHSADAPLQDLEGLPSTDKAGSAPPAVETINLTKRYGSITALAGLTMRVPHGSVFGFLGPNGAGKTTAVKLLVGLARPTSGRGSVLGAPLGNRLARRRIGYLPELFRYQAWLSAREVLQLHCSLADIPQSRRKHEVEAALDTVGLVRRGDDRVGTFSKGMQQRLGLGVALLGEPELVFLDEPTSALDPVGRHDVREIIRGLKQRGAAVFLNSHLLSEVEQICDLLAVVDRGRVIATGTLDELLGSTSSVRLRLGQVGAAGEAALRRFGSLDVEGDSYTVRGLSAEDVPALVAAVVALGGQVFAVEPRHQSLEDRFLQLLGGSADGNTDHRTSDPA